MEAFLLFRAAARGGQMYKQEKIKPKKKKKKKIKGPVRSPTERQLVGGGSHGQKDSGLVVVYPADEKRRGDYYHRFVINSVSPS
jgi:hypothetical protein